MSLTSRSVFAAPGEQGRGRWRALTEVTGGALLILLTQMLLDGLADVPGWVQFLLGAAALVPLAVRRRFPRASLLGAAAVLGVLPGAGLPAAVIAYTTAKHLVVPRHRTAVLLASAGATMLVSTVFAQATGLGGHALGLTLGGVLAATTLLVPALVGASGGQQERLLRALQERAAAAEAARRLVDRESRTQERSRIAAEMHDLVGHRLSLISLHTGGLEMALRNESPELREEAVLVRRATGDAMRELREVLGVLGPLGRDDTGSGTLTDATGTRSDVEALAEESRSGSIPVDLVWEGPDLDERPAQVRRAVHRVVRESLTNVHRYATGAHVTVTVTHTDGQVTVLVRNGLPPQAPEAVTGLGSGRGLVGLRERVTLLGGTLETGPTAAGGFTVTARMPARPEPGAGTGAGGGAGGGAGAGAARSDAPSHMSPGAPDPSASSDPSGSEHPAPGVRRPRTVRVLTGFLGLAGVGVMMLGGLLLVSAAVPQPAPPEPEEPRVGMSREKVEDSVYGDDTTARAAATGHEPRRPKGVSDCLYPMVPLEDFEPSAEGKGGGGGSASGEPADATDPDPVEGPGHLRITRYCFRGDTLAAIDRFTVPVVSQTPPWESP
ncbi:sensor histidine kinase [Streptomyces sp. NPDC054796]